MNDKFTNTHDDNFDVSEFLNEVSEETQVNSQFASELERQLREKHRPKTGWSFPTFQQTIPSLGWIALVIAFGFILNWSIRNLIPNRQPGSNTTPTGFVCPVTEPNGIAPPGENSSDNYYSNGELWTALWPDGKVIMSPGDKLDDGSFSMKWGWWRGVSGPLTIEGHRLDAEAEPLRAEIPDGYGEAGFQVSGLIFPTTGCWEVTGHVGDSSLTFITEVVYDGPLSTPESNTDINATPQPNETPVVNDGGVDWRGTKLYLNVPLPEAPTQTNLYQLKEDAPATVEQARALAEQFGIQGNVFVSQIPGTNTTEYLITDGKQSISVQTTNLYTYTADMARAFNNLGGHTSPNAEATINEFLSSHGFDFPHIVEEGEFFGGYIVEPLSPDGFPMRYEYFTSRPMKVILDENGQVLQIEANLMNYEQVGTQTYNIISAEEAFQKLLDDTLPGGKIESALSSSLGQSQEWRRDYPPNETITIYGYASSAPALDPSQPAFIQIDGYTVTGNISGIDALERNTFVEATGQFIDKNGVEKFNIDSWQISEFMQDGITGTLTRENGQVVIDTDQGERLIIEPDIPADVPVPFENAFVVGVRKGNIYDWTLIDNRFALGGGGGGGGGGGTGFYKLNLSGTPVPFPTTSPATSVSAGNYTVQSGDTLSSIAQTYGTTVDEIKQLNGLSDDAIYIDQQLIVPGAENAPSDIGQQLDGQRGTITIANYKKADGSLRTEYVFSFADNTSQSTFLLEGDNLQELQNYQNMPVDIWGTVERNNDSYGLPIVTVDRFEVPYPDLQFQILRGTQKLVNVEGQSAVLFTTDEGQSYIQTYNGWMTDSALLGNEGDEVLLETLTVPGETLGGYPVLRVFSSAMAISPKNGQPIELTITADQVYTTEEPPFLQESYTPPALTIEKVELMYFVTNPHWQTDHLDGSPLYLQPVWRFYGHYDNGGEFDIIIQALQQEYLLPELDSFVQGG